MLRPNSCEAYAFEGLCIGAKVQLSLASLCETLPKLFEMLEPILIIVDDNDQGIIMSTQINYGSFDQRNNKGHESGHIQGQLIFSHTIHTL